MPLDLLLLAARVGLAGAFAAAGVAKLADRGGTRRTMAEFGVPHRLGAPLSLGLPWIELSVAAALLPARTARVGAAISLALLAAFTVALSVALARGSRPACRCFGRVSARPVGWQTLARNALLMLLAAGVALAPSRPPLERLVSWAPASVAERVTLGVASFNVLALLGLGWLFVQLLKQNGTLLVRLEEIAAQVANPAVGRQRAPAAGLPAGSPAPAFEARDLEGRTHTLGELADGGRPALLVFSNPECGPCRALLPEVAAWQAQYEADLTVVLVSEGTPEANRGEAERVGLRRVWLQGGREVAEGFQAYGTPSAVLVEGGGRIGAALAVGADAIRELLLTAVRERSSGTRRPQRPAARRSSSVTSTRLTS